MYDKSLAFMLGTNKEWILIYVMSEKYILWSSLQNRNILESWFFYVQEAAI